MVEMRQFMSLKNIKKALYFYSIHNIISGLAEVCYPTVCLPLSHYFTHTHTCGTNFLLSQPDQKNKYHWWVSGEMRCIFHFGRSSLEIENLKLGFFVLPS